VKRFASGECHCLFLPSLLPSRIRCTPRPVILISITPNTTAPAHIGIRTSRYRQSTNNLVLLPTSGPCQDAGLATSPARSISASCSIRAFLARTPDFVVSVPHDFTVDPPRLVPSQKALPAKVQLLRIPCGGSQNQVDTHCKV
jgi:hypothetical protein